MNQRNNLSTILEAVSKFIPVFILPLLVPIFFLPITTEFFEFNKLTLLVFATSILGILWVAKLIIGHKLEMVKSVLDFPLVVFTAVYALATIFSINKTASIYGSQGRWLGLFAVLVSIVFYYIATPIFRDPKAIKNALMALLASIGISSLVSILSYYSIFIASADFFKLQNFSLSGSSVETALLAAVAFVIGLAMIAYEKNPSLRIALVGSNILNLFYIVIAGTLASWAILAVGIVGMVFYTDLSKAFKQSVYYLAIMGVGIAFAIVALVPTTRSVLLNPNFSKEAVLPATASWIVASSTIQSFPLLATGPGTFQINFTRYRPLSLNATDLWNVRFDTAYNEVFNIMSSLGLLGLLAAFFLIGRVLKLTNHAKFTDSQEGLTEVLSLAVVSLLVSGLFTYATITSMFVLVLLVSLLVAAHTYIDSHSKVAQVAEIGPKNIQAVASLGDSSAINKEYSKYIFGGLIVVIIGYGLYLWGRNYLGEYYMRQAFVALARNDGSATYTYESKAIQVNPTRDSYQNAFAQTNLALANTIAAKENLTDQDKQTIQGLISQAIQTTRVATEVVNPLSAANWETRALIYRSIVNVADNASDWAISAYNTAIQLDPTNPRLRLDLGGMYYANKDYQSAANQFRQATALKTDYANAYYNFAESLIQLNQLESAKQALQITKSLLTEGSEDVKLVDQEIASIDAKLVQTGTQATSGKPTVEQITAQQGQTQPQNQEPLNNAGQSEPLDNQNLDLGTLPSNSQPAK